VKLVHLVGFITKKLVTRHGHMNVNSDQVTRGPSKRPGFVCLFVYGTLQCAVRSLDCGPVS
jgi:hypothetical protein